MLALCADNKKPIVGVLIIHGFDSYDENEEQKLDVLNDVCCDLHEEQFEVMGVKFELCTCDSYDELFLTADILELISDKPDEVLFSEQELVKTIKEEFPGIFSVINIW